MSASGSPGSTRSAAIARLVRSLSVNLTKGTDLPVSTSGDLSSTINETVSQNTNVPQVENKRLSAFERFMQIWKKKGTKIIFPPNTWFDDRHELSAAEAAALLLPTPAIDGEEETIREEDIVQDDTQVEGIEGNETTPKDQVERPPSPVSFARKIQDMISSLPTLPMYPSSSSSSTVKSPSIPPTLSTDGDSTAQVPPSPAPITDSKLISFLSSASIMNGSISRGRQSVWSILDRLRWSAPKSSVGEQAEQRLQDDHANDDSSIMMYAPLQPDADSEVEIARSEICSVDEEGEIIAERPGEDMNHPDGLLKGKGKEKEVEQIPSRDIKEHGTGNSETKKVKEIRVWLPSMTKISIQATWWGYRLYLPPPVIDTLNNKRMEAAKRAALITTALKWLLDHLPVKVVPPQFRPVLTVLKRLVPYLGYIGAFIAWSWGAIKAFDKGNGVVLTATWLLPVALIPGSWDDDLLPAPAPSTPRSNNSTT